VLVVSARLLLFNGMDLWDRETVPWAHERAHLVCERDLQAYEKVRLVCGMVLRDHPALVLFIGW
jgi:hypothetical protein